MTVTVDRLIEAGVLAPVHQAFADTVRRLDGDREPLVSLAAALASDQLMRGHVCFDLQQAATIPFAAGEETQESLNWTDWPGVADWLDRLATNPLVELRDAADHGDDLNRPLVLDLARQRVYLARYWFCQQRLAQAMAERIAAPPQPQSDHQIAALIRRLFPNAHEPASRDQCLAAASAVDRHFTVITGGPGTGKTTTVARLLALRLMLHQSPDEPGRGGGAAGRQLLLALDPIEDLKVLLMAPTGKAAQRLNESLRRAAGQLDVLPQIRDALQNLEAGTIHRLLGWTSAPPERGGPFRHNAGFPLDADVVLVDEASMVDIALMWRLFDAVRPDAQIILLGDHDQLASVEAGGVLSDLCGDSGTGSLSATRRAQLAQRTGLKLPGGASDTDSVLSGSVLTLRYSHRFSADSTLGQLAEAIRAGDADAVLAQLRQAEADGDESVAWMHDTSAVTSGIVRHACDGYRDMLELVHRAPDNPGDVVQRLSDCRVLCAHREGRWGEVTFNRLIIDRLAAEGLVDLTSGLSPGRTVMVTRNDYRLNLFNGDVGIVAGDDVDGLSILFEDPAQSDGFRRVPAALVRDPADCFAMTIHKSQGSEFHRVIVVLPDHDSPVVSRELLYTAVTRVRDEEVSGETHAGQLIVAASEESLRQAVARPIRRTSGLRDAITAMTAEMQRPQANP